MSEYIIVIGGTDPVARGVSKDPIIMALGYNPVHAGSGTYECVKFVRDQLLVRRDHKLSAVELKHSFAGDHIMRTVENRTPHNCVYLILDANAKEMLRIDGMAKGYAGEGARGALTLDTYLDFMRIPTKRVFFSRDSLRTADFSKVIYAPQPEYPHFISCRPDDLDRAKRRASDAGWDKKSIDDHFDKLHIGMPLDEMMGAMNFHGAHFS